MEHVTMMSDSLTTIYLVHISLVREEMPYLTYKEQKHQLESPL